jgi:putative mRNA 3-end processing factor
MHGADLITATARGLYCAAGDFYIDPWQPVQNAVITHAHADHLRAGSARYYTAARVSLHPAGHILGSAQVRVERGGEVWVVSGDYKRDPDPTCDAFEVVPCDVFISEATFALPAYRWTPADQVALEILEWWHANRRQGVASVLFAYALGKAQRILAELSRVTEEPVFVHGAVASVVETYRASGVHMLPTVPATQSKPKDYAGAMVLAPPGAAGSPWLRRFGEYRTGFCSGWMRVRGNRRRRGYDRGFVLSDHADWPSLLGTIRDTGARRILLTHGHTDALCRYLRELGVDAAALSTEYGAEE